MSALQAKHNFVLGFKVSGWGLMIQGLGTTAEVSPHLFGLVSVVFTTCRFFDHTIHGVEVAERMVLL